MDKPAKKILIVDDDPDALELVGTRIEANGYEVIMAEEGEAAIEKAQGEKPALLILDLDIPAINGFEVCRVLKSDFETGNIPIIILSAQGQESDKKRGKKLGADAYLVKPFESGILLDEIKFLLEKR